MRVRACQLYSQIPYIQRFAAALQVTPSSESFPFEIGDPTDLALEIICIAALWEHAVKSLESIRISTAYPQISSYRSGFLNRYLDCFIDGDS